MTNDGPAQNIVTPPAPVPSADALAKAASAASKGRGPAPVHLWNPPFCGDLDIRIARDGLWYYLGTPIGRAPLVKLFANILKREGDRYFLVTPVEKVGITVDDAPLFAVDFAAEGTGRDQILRLVTKTEDEVTVDAAHALRIARDPVTQEPSPYVHIRAGLEARIDRKTFYRLIDLGAHEMRDGARWFGLWSSGVFFPIIPSAELT
ncbi:MAG: DUF1285 domain-containing protein [Paracoccaceae bacterium]